jgi:hypothetical protein
MLVIKEALSTQALVCLEQLISLDLSSIAAYLTNSETGYGWTRQQALQAIGRYKTFLFVSYLHPEISLVPTQEIDRVWHCHILHTRKYREDCEMLFGYFIDHEPESETWDEANPQNMDAAFTQTQALLAVFEQYFEQAASGESDLHQSQRLELKTEKFKLENDSDKECLHLYRSACGRPILQLRR